MSLFVIFSMECQNNGHTRIISPEAYDGIVHAGNVDGVLEWWVDQFPMQQALSVQFLHVFQCKRLVKLSSELTYVENTYRSASLHVLILPGSEVLQII